MGQAFGAPFFRCNAETEQLARLASTDDYVYGYEAFFGDSEPTFRGE